MCGNMGQSIHGTSVHNISGFGTPGVPIVTNAGCLWEDNLHPVQGNEVGASFCTR